MDILLIIDEKQRSSNKEQVIKLIEKEEFIHDNGRYKVLFHEINFAFQKILSICGSWTTTELYIDNITFDPSDILFVASCHKKSRCDGLCILNDGTCDYSELFNIIRNMCDTSCNYSNNQYNIKRFETLIIGLEFIKKSDEDIYILDKENLKNRILKEYELQLKICPSISEEKIIHQINSLPEKIILKKTQYEKALPRSEPRDSQKPVGLTDFQKEKYKELAELIAPIFAREIKNILIEMSGEIHGTTEKEQK